MGRAISDKALLQGFEGQILLSLSKTIEKNKKDYYNAIKEAQRSNVITPWLIYFSQMALQSQSEAEVEINFILKKTKFFDKFKNELNERQLKVINRMLEEGPEGFTGGMSAKKYMSIAKTTKSTATRDLQKLVALNIFLSIGGGHSTRYEIKI
jgi:Fic family protein